VVKIEGKLTEKNKWEHTNPDPDFKQTFVIGVAVNYLEVEQPQETNKID